MTSETKNAERDFVSITGGDEFDVRSLTIEFEDEKILVTELLEKHREEDLITCIGKIIARINDGLEFSREQAAEWSRYLIALMRGQGANLINPYSDLSNYSIRAFSDNTAKAGLPEAIEILDEMPDTALKKTDAEALALMKKTLYVTALGGTDSSFYNGLSREEILEFSRAFYGPEVFASFHKYNVADLIPRGFAAKDDGAGNGISNVESMILQAYHAGIRFVAVISNAKTQNAIRDFLARRLAKLQDLRILVTAQPLLPVIKACARTRQLTISAENGGYQGGHGHGFEHCLKDGQVRRAIEKNGLEFFIFGNGDNAAMLNWGAAPYAATFKMIQALRQRPGFEDLGIAFFLVWEYLRKGGFTFLLTHKKTGKQIAQLFEAELAEKSGADIKSLEFNRGGYNTNVAAGLIAPVLARFRNLPMALKRKSAGDCTNFLFEASLGTAMTTHQNPDGSSVFDSNAAIYVLGPKTAKFQHWNHISIRKRDDLFAFFTSLYKIGKIATPYGEFPLIITERNATQSYPCLRGNFANPEILGTKGFFEIFKDARLDVDDFFGTIKIDLLEEEGKPRGRIRFEGNIKLAGAGEISALVPAGELWIIKDKVFDLKGIDHQIQRQEVKTAELQL